jgi:predicted nucleic acid-binding protein
MVVVADTSPLNYLALIGRIDLLPALYRRVLIPQAVMDELRHPKAPLVVTTFAQNSSHWLEVVEMGATHQIEGLDAGESAAIVLAEQHPGSLLLIDETAGREEASRRLIAFTGTLGVLRDASQLGLVDLRSALADLRATSFRVSARTLATLLSQGHPGP